MGESIVYRKYKKEDWSSICDIFAQSSAIEIEGCCDIKALRPLEYYPDASIIRNKSKIVCACSGEDVVGYISFCTSKLSILSLYLLPNYIGKGIGKFLLRIALINMGVKLELEDLDNHKVEEGVIEKVPSIIFTNKIIHIVCMTNNSKAVRLYWSHGFKPTGLTEELLNGYPCSYIRMSRPLVDPIDIRSKNIGYT